MERLCYCFSAWMSH